MVAANRQEFRGLSLARRVSRLSATCVCFSVSLRLKISRLYFTFKLFFLFREMSCAEFSAVACFLGDFFSDVFFFVCEIFFLALLAWCHFAFLNSRKVCRKPRQPKLGKCFDFSIGGKIDDCNFHVTKRRSWTAKGFNVARKIPLDDWVISWLVPSDVF